MAFDGLFLHASIAEIQAFLPAKINKIQGVSDTDTLFQLRGQRSSKTLMISAHSQHNRIHFSNKRYTTFETPSNFIMVLRKFLDGGTMEGVEQLGLDRAMKFTIRVRNELGDLHLRYLYVELMGKYANLILVDADGRIVDAIKRIPPFLENKRTIHPGAQFVPVEQQEKKNPFLCVTLELEASLQTQYYGFSKILETEVRHRLAQGAAWSDIATMLATAHTLYTYPSTTKRVFHILELTHLQQTPITAPLMDGIDALFDVVEEQERIRQQSGDLFKVVKKEIVKNKAKLPKLEKTLAQAYNG
ncbi:MAG: NFACT family protein, partial [Erysipelotrichaceae bacterium]